MRAIVSPTRPSRKPSCRHVGLDERVERREQWPPRSHPPPGLAQLERRKVGVAVKIRLVGFD